MPTSADFIDPLEVVGELGTVDDHAALLPAFDAVDAAKERRLAAAGGAADHDPLPAHDLQAHLAQRLKIREPLAQPDDLDRDFVARGADILRPSRRNIRRRLPRLVCGLAQARSPPVR
jgi:hypothetical protein